MINGHGTKDREREAASARMDRLVEENTSAKEGLLELVRELLEELSGRNGRRPRGDSH